jgi:hypothetical protein
MRSEFFNQVKRNRQKFYYQMDQIKKKEESPFFDVSEAILESQRSPAFSLPKLNIKIPEIQFANGFKNLRVICSQVYNVSKPYIQVFLRIMVVYASVIGKEINRGYSKITGVVSKYAEFFQLFIYTNLIDLFEDDSDAKPELLLKSSDTKNTSGQPENKQHTVKQNEFNKETTSSWFSRIFGKMLISLELDDIQLNAVKRPIHKPEEENLVVTNKESFQKNSTSVILSFKDHLIEIINTINPVKLLRRDYAEINKFI